MAAAPRVLVVDGARAVRAALDACLHGEFDVRQEGDGEAAWQALVLDQSIRIVVAGTDLPRMDGFQLLERIRASKLRRLRQMPVVFLVEADADEVRSRAQALGVSDFLLRGGVTPEIVLRLKNLVTLDSVRESLEGARATAVQDTQSGLFTRKYLELQAAQALSQSARHGIELSVMVLGFDGFESLVERLGEEQSAMVGLRFSQLLKGKIRQEDSLGHFGTGQFAIVSPGTSLAACATFAERVRQAVEATPIKAGNERVAVTVSVGLAGVPGDAVHSAGNLLDLAGQRMAAAHATGGNRLVAGGETRSPKPMSLHHALELLNAGRGDAVRPHLGNLGRQCLPLLKLLDEEFGLALPLAEVERRLKERDIP